ENEEDDDQGEEGLGNIEQDMVKTFKNNQAGHPKNTPRSITAIMGPAEARPTQPKLLAREERPPRTETVPIPNARMNGVVRGPVVTPPESKATGINSG